MFCNKCGNALDNNAMFCDKCGQPTGIQQQQQPAYQQPTYQQPAYQQPTYQQPGYQDPAYPQPGYYNPVPQQPPMPMGWYKFLIYFSLFAGAVMNLITGIMMLSGSHYGENSALVYAMIGDLKEFDSVMGIVAIGLAVFGIFTRFQLSGYKKSGPMMVMILYIAVAVYNAAYVIGLQNILPSLVSGYVDFTSSYSSIASSIVFAIVNYIYFKKRAHLFVK